MLRSELNERIAEVLRLRREGFYVDALEEEVQLYRDVVDDDELFRRLPLGVYGIVRIQRIERMHRELAP